MAEEKKDTQARTWHLVINNPQDKDLGHEKVKEILHSFPSLRYFCMCDEIGEKGTPHTHVLLCTRNPVKFSTIINKFNNNVHAEETLGNPEQNREYIRKEGKWEDTEKKETNLPETFEEWGELPQGHKGKKTPFTILFNMIEKGMTNSEILRKNPDYMKYINHIERTRQALREEEFKNKWRDIECIYVFGETNTNKSRTYMEMYGYENVYRVTNYTGNAVWDGYRGQDVVIFEEYRSQIMISEMLTWLEGYPNCSLRARYTDKVACYTKVVFISNIPLEKQYPNVQEESPETWRAFLRRIQKIFFHESVDRIVEYKTVQEYLERDNSFRPLPKDAKTPFDEKEELPDDLQEKLPFE